MNDLVQLATVPNAVPDADAGFGPARWRSVKAAYTTRFVWRRLLADRPDVSLLAGASVTPRPGDVVLARVTQVGQHTRIESPDSRRAMLYPGDEILVAYGHRYAPDQFEAEVPADLGPAHLVAAGGVAGRIVSAHRFMDAPTEIVPLGLLTDARGVVTLDRFAPCALPGPRDAAVPGSGPTTIAVLGTSMNSGKSTTAAAIVRGLTASGLRVAAGKVTGTGAGGDPGLFRDSGAVRVRDFTDFGHASTYLLSHDRVRALFGAVLDELAGAGPDVIVVEIADGLFQAETARLSADPLFGQCVDHVVFAAADALGAVAGISVLAGRGVAVAAVSGVLTASPLATREARAALDVPVLSVDELASQQVSAVLPLRAPWAQAAPGAGDALAS